MPLIPPLGRQRQVDISEFEACLGYRVSSRTARAVIQRNPVSEKKTVSFVQVANQAGLYTGCEAHLGYEGYMPY